MSEAQGNWLIGIIIVATIILGGRLEDLISIAKRVEQKVGKN